MSKCILLLIALNVGQAFSKGYGQGKINLTLNNVSLKKALKQIEKNSDYNFLYNDDILPADANKNIVVNNASLAEVMGILLKNTDLDYRQSSDRLVIISKGKTDELVTGKVTDSKGEPLIGVSVQVQGASRGTVTNEAGVYRINADAGATIAFSYMGFKTQYISLKDKSIANGQYTVNVVLEDQGNELSEVVVVGFATQRRVNLTGAVSTIDSKALESRPVQNVAQALQGLAPGLNVTSTGNGGELNGTKSINVRGTGTIGIGSSGSPLVLIDGMDGDLNSVNPQDIDNISILKDAAASSIYGSRAPFGVILITTKKGKAGRPRINYNTTVRQNSPVFLPNMTDSYSFVNYFNDASVNGGGGPIFDPNVVDRVLKYKNGELASNDVALIRPDGRWNYDFTNGNIDWYDEYYGNKPIGQEHALSVSGGNEGWQYYASANYLDQEGLMRYGTDLLDRYTLSGKLSGKLSKFVSLDFTSRLTRQDYSRARYMEDGFYDNVARRARPIRPKYDPNGFLMADINYIDAFENGGRRKEQQDWQVYQVKTTITPVKDWNIIGELNYRINPYMINEFGLKSLSYAADGKTRYQAVTSLGNEEVYQKAYRSNFFNPNIYTNYTRNIGNHNFTGLAGFQGELMKWKEMEVTRQDLISKAVPELGKTTGTPSLIGGRSEHWATAGVFGRLNYAYKDKYLFETTLRYDGSSRFREEYRWNLLPSASIGWNVAQEKFWEPLAEKIQMLKLRASYGVLGNQNTNELYPSLQRMFINANRDNGNTSLGTWLVGGVRPNISNAPQLISSTLTWERVSSWNTGVDISSLNNRLTANFDLFTRYTDDMVGPAPTLPDVLGTRVPRTNNTDLKTAGWELSLGWEDRVRAFSYGVNLNLSDAKTTITRFPNETNSIQGINNANPERFIQGDLMGNIWGYETIGIAKSKAEMDAHLATLPNGGQNAIGSLWNAGDIMYKDLNGDGKISAGAETTGDPGDRRILGNTTPRYTFGLNLDAGWKGFDIRMFWQGVGKRDFAPGPNQLTFWGTSESGQFWSTAFEQHMDYFRPEGHALGANSDPYYPRPVFGAKNQQAQTKYLLNAAYARLKNLQFGYTLPTSLTQRFKIQNVRLFVSGENLLTITNLPDTHDPESLGIGRQGGTVYPMMKVISGGLSVNF